MPLALEPLDVQPEYVLHDSLRCASVRKRDQLALYDASNVIDKNIASKCEAIDLLKQITRRRGMRPQAMAAA